MMIGIIGAMDVEVEALKQIMDSVHTRAISTVKYYNGEIKGIKAVVATAGVGKVNAAVCTQTMIMEFNPDIIINVGVAGGMSPELGIGDIAVADTVVEHDMDTTALGDEMGFITGIDKVYMDCDKKISQIMFDAANEVCGIKVVRGTIASGDQFIASDEQRSRIINSFKNVVATEMEGASIGHVCTMNNKPFAVLRAISDGANSDSHMDFPTFTKLAARNSIAIILKMFEKLAN